jgi:hypothetical protein
MATRKRSIAPGQLSLFGEMSDSSPAALHPEPPSAIQHQDIDPAVPVDDEPISLDLATYSRDNLKHQGPHDQARRSWLREWAEKRGYEGFHFTLHGKYSGYYQTGIAKGKEDWTNFLEKAVQYDVYCCYIAALKQHPLQDYLEDAERRGEIRFLNDTLVWRPAKVYQGEKGQGLA